jgi:hypothetical protein
MLVNGRTAIDAAATLAPGLPALNRAVLGVGAPGCHFQTRIGRSIFLTLISPLNDADALKAARDFERAAKISLDLAQQQMQTGNANVLNLLTAQQTYLQAISQVVQARAARLSDTAALFQALGGGWWKSQSPINGDFDETRFEW